MPQLFVQDTKFLPAEDWANFRGNKIVSQLTANPALPDRPPFPRKILTVCQ